MFGLLPKFHINNKFDSGVMTSFVLLGNCKLKIEEKNIRLDSDQYLGTGTCSYPKFGMGCLCTFMSSQKYYEC